MTKPQRVLFCVALSGALTLGGVVCSWRRDLGPSESRGGEASAATPEFSAKGTGICPTPITVRYQPQDDLDKTTQQGADCFAWQNFIALGWPASEDRGQPDTKADAGSFGNPGQEGAFPASVWQTYLDSSEVFLPNAQPPPAWDSAPTASGCMPASKEKTGPLGLLLRHRRAFVRATANLSQVAEFTPGSALQPTEDPQLSGRGWLADTNSNLVWYEVKLNEAEFNHITDGGLYNAANQWAVSKPGQPGVTSPPGAIHLKAAWRQITNPADYKRYLMTDACIPTPGGGSKWVQLGLVGLHIVQKTPFQPQWVWATFEHVDNAPTQGQSADAGQTYSFYNPSCTPSPIPASCLPPDAGPAQRGCDGGMPAYSLSAYFDGGSCAPYPTQVVRQTPIPSSSGNPIQQLNASVQETIRGTNADSVFQYYQLVNAVWWPPPSPNNMTGGAAIPLPQGGTQPSQGEHVANTVLETYAQQTQCLDCHTFGAVSTANDAGGQCEGGVCAADFSFMFSHARLPADAGTR